MTRNEAKEYQTALTKAVNEVAATFGYPEAKPSGCRFGDSLFNVKFEWDLPDASGTIVTKEASIYKHYAGLYGLPLDAVENETVFDTFTGNIKFIGANSRAKKYPFIYKNLANGKSYKCSVAQACSFAGV